MPAPSPQPPAPGARRAGPSDSAVARRRCAELPEPETLPTPGEAPHGNVLSPMLSRRPAAVAVDGHLSGTPCFPQEKLTFGGQVPKASPQLPARLSSPPHSPRVSPRLSPVPEDLQVPLVRYRLWLVDPHPVLLGAVHTVTGWRGSSVILGTAWGPGIGAGELDGRVWGDGRRAAVGLGAWRAERPSH